MIVKLAKISALLFIVLTIGNIFWYFNSFYRYTDKIDLVVANTKKEISGDINQLKSLALIAESEQGIVNWSSRQAYYELSYKHNKRSNAVWQLNWLLWTIALPAYLDEDDEFLIWCHYALDYQNHWGINNASKIIFGQPILELPIRKQALIIAMVKSPTLYQVGSEKLQSRVKEILLKYENL